MSVDYEWDGRKANTNRTKHGVDFADAVAVFTDPHAITLEDERYTEPRFATIGQDALGRTLVVVYTWRRAQAIRLISARRATPAERRRYKDEG